MNTEFSLIWTPSARATFVELRDAAHSAPESTGKAQRRKKSKQEGLFAQVIKCLSLLENNPRHPSLQTHEFTSIEHPYKKGGKVFEAYVQHRTPGAYRVFWCYGPGKGEITLIAITPHP
jgi:hypothetical protein